MKNAKIGFLFLIIFPVLITVLPKVVLAQNPNHPVPVNLVGIARDGIVELDWETPLIYPADISDNKMAQKSGSKELWDISFTFNTVSPDEYGIETDGEYFYTTQPGTPGFFRKYTLEGACVDSFTIQNIENIYDLAYDGEYFYGCGGGNFPYIYVLDLANKCMVDGFSTSLTALTHIAYDPEAYNGDGGLWLGNATELHSIRVYGWDEYSFDISLTGMKGLAYDNSTENPCLWIYNEEEQGLVIYQYDINNHSLTGVSHNVSDIPGYIPGSRSAGGLCTTTQIDSTHILLIGVIRQNPGIVFGYQLSTLPAPPSNLLSYNIYRDGDSIANVPAGTVEYFDERLWIGEYSYTVTAVYGEPDSGESEPAGPVTVCIMTTTPPLFEDWSSGLFFMNNWAFENELTNWGISDSVGNPPPTAVFDGTPTQTNYSSSLISFPFYVINEDSSDLTVWLEADLFLEDIAATGTEKLFIELENMDTIIQIYTVSNAGNIGWYSLRFDISSFALQKSFRVRFTVSGENSAYISRWGLDNINVYWEMKCNPPQNLVANIGSNGSAYICNLEWDPPAEENHALLGYNLFRNDVLVNDSLITDVYYQDTVSAGMLYEYYVTAVFWDCESAASNKEEVIVVGMDKLKENYVLISPNPVKDVFKIDYPDEFLKMRISDSYGRILLQKNIPGNSTIINVKDFPQGIYFVQLMSNQGKTICRRLVVEK